MNGEGLIRKDTKPHPDQPIPVIQKSGPGSSNYKGSHLNGTGAGLSEVGMTDDDDKSYHLTPKGWLSAELLPRFTLDESDKIWQGLTDMVAKKAAENGMTEGVPCLVLHGGGHCITAQAGKP